jgi:hypothetical protein
MLIAAHMVLCFGQPDSPRCHGVKPRHLPPWMKFGGQSQPASEWASLSARARSARSFSRRGQSQPCCDVAAWCGALPEARFRALSRPVCEKKSCSSTPGAAAVCGCTDRARQACRARWWGLGGARRPGSARGGRGSCRQRRCTRRRAARRCTRSELPSAFCAGTTPRALRPPCS